MNPFNSRIVLLLSVLFIFTSCSTIRINYSGKKALKSEKVVLISTMIGKLQQPIFPLIDAGIFNEKTNSIAELINDAEKRKVDDFRTILSSRLTKNFNCTVLPIQEMQESEAFKTISQKYNFKKSLLTTNDNFPLVFASPGDFNPFEFERGNVPAYFSTSSNYKQVISFIANQMNTDLVVVSYSTIVVPSVGMFGIYGFVNLNTHIYIFDNEGDMIVHGNTWSKNMNTPGDVAMDYEMQLKQFEFILQPLLEKISLTGKQ